MLGRRWEPADSRRTPIPLCAGNEENRIDIQPAIGLFGLVLVVATLTASPDIVAEETVRDQASCSSGSLLVASPDWRDQVIYFAMIDRFENGDPRNDDQGAGEFDPADGRRYSGGDLAGITRRLDYIHELGATAVWVTPPVANQWWDARHQFSGYHGYWAENFMQVDAHYGSLADYQQLSRCLHSKQMFLIQDIVVNHVGNFFRYDGPLNPDKPEYNFQINRDAKPHGAPTQKPFSLNDVRKEKDRKAAVYHWTPSIVDYSDPAQVLNGQLADLDDLNTENTIVRKALRKSYAYWIREVGVDAYRVDTAFYVPPDFFDDFLRANDRKAPGILDVASQTGHDNFLLFGEGFALDAPYRDESARRIDHYLRDDQGKPRLPGMLNFPLYGSTLDVFARGRPTAVMAHRIRNMMQVHANPYLMPSFVDNHDVDRFLSSGSEAGLKQALLLIMTLPGIPVIYYGTEQGFSEQRAAMFASGFGSKGVDHFDRGAPLYRYLQRVIQLRRAHPLLSRSAPTVLAANAASSGALSYRYGEGDDALIIVFNSSDRPSLLAGVATGLAEGTQLTSVFSIDANQANAVVGEGGRLSMPLPARSGTVWKVDGAIKPGARLSKRIVIDALPRDPVSASLEVNGLAKGADRLRLVVDGDLPSATDLVVDKQGRWQASIDTSDFVDPDVEHELVAWSQTSSRVSSAQAFRVDRTWKDQVDIEDPADDDHGPNGHTLYPIDPLWTAKRPLDLRGVRVSTSGGSLRIVLTLRNLVAAWNPPNGFDHLATTIYVQLPNRNDGARVMPLQNAELPEAMRWHLRLRANGWSNRLTSADGASVDNEGTPLSPSAELKVDRATNTLRFTFAASALGHPATLSGTRLYVTTWDYDGGYRHLNPQPSSFEFGGGDGRKDPLIMDSSSVITLP